MKKNELTVNDVLESLAITINDALRPDKKSKNKKNNAYFWAFKFLLLLLFIFFIKESFKVFEEIGVTLIYTISKSLRSILSFIWVGSLRFIKGLIILYLMYDNFKVFVNSEYYNNLYKNNKKLRNRKENIFYLVELLLKVSAVFFMIAIAILGIIAVYGLLIIIIMLIKNIHIISPLIIMGALFALSLVILLHIKNKFFGSVQTITTNHFIFVISVLVIGVFLFNYEVSSYEYMNTLPNEMETIVKEASFELKEGSKIKIKNDSKLNNVEVVYDETIGDEMYVSFEYFKTAKVRYTYTFNNNDYLELAFSSSLDFHPGNVNDVFKLVHSTFNRKTIYNYNLFKYPNITVRINPKYEKYLLIK